ncbi:MAG: type II secretion system protein [Candidatus Paceibacterota bacterium]
MKSKAFTLIELLVVVAIIGILSGFVIVQMNGAINAANDGKKKANLSSIKKALIVYGVENGNSYPVESGCTIGSCSTLDPALSSLLPQNLNGTYTYESDGSSFSVSSILSSGYAYTYDSVTNSFTTEEPTAGSCGTASKTYLYTETTYGSDTFCTLGTSTPSSPSFPALGSSTSWTCPGSNGGATANCSASRGATPVSGDCGTASKTYLYSETTYGSDTFCIQGTANPSSPSFPELGSSTNWTCVGSNGGTDDSCTASRNNTPINGSCGTKNGKYAATTPSETEACLTGTLTNMNGTYSWTCSGQYGGTNSGTCATVAATYTVTQFKTPGTTSWTAPAGANSIQVQYLVVAGGGGGGGCGPQGDAGSGGGGAGGLLQGTLSVLGGSTYSVTVGNGGGGGAGSANLGSNGGSSSFSSEVVAIGGGGGGTGKHYAGVSGGSGGGGGFKDGSYGYAGGSGTSGQGYAGSSGGYTGQYWGGAGGGAGGPGVVGDTTGGGGAGVVSSITGTAVTYARGGNGGGQVTNPGKADGGTASGINGTANLGGGGGSYYCSPIGAGGNGGSGIVVIKYINNY